MKAATIFLIAFVFASLFASVLSVGISEFPWSESPPNADTNCLTTWLWNQKKLQLGEKASIHPRMQSMNAASCPTEGKCDNPFVRDASKTKELDLKFVFHVMAAANGSWPSGLTQDEIDSMMASVQKDLQKSFITFSYKTVVHRNSSFYCISAFGLNNKWAAQIDDMKARYAVDPTTTINVFCSCQTSGAFGTLLGIGTFPWDESALTSYGGLWINSITPLAKAQKDGDMTLIHELGHNIGLWHTFHGVSEVTACGPCYENYHSLGDFQANYVGDFCADTPATPQNFYCRPPEGKDCNGTSWGVTAYQNYMGYSQLPPPGCQSEYSTQQILRAHCWMCDTLKTQVQNKDAC